MKKFNDRTILIVLFIFCLALRTALITQKNLWYDEAFSWHLAGGSFFDIIIQTAGDIHPPFYYLLLKIWNLVFGDSIMSMRLLSALFSTVALYFIYRIAASVLNKPDALLSAVLFILSPLNLYFSQEIRMASLNLLLTAASTFCFIKLVSSRTSPKTHSIKICYVITSVLALYTHYFSFFILLSQFCYTMSVSKSTDKKVFKSVIYAFSLILLLYLPWIPIMIKQIGTGQPWRGTQNVLQVTGQVFTFARDISLGFYFRFDDLQLINFLQILILLLVCVFLFRITRNFKDGYFKNSPEQLIILLIFVPLAFSIIISFFQWIEFFRYLSIIVPYIIIAGFITFKKLPSPIRSLCLVLFLFLNLYGDYLYYKFDFKNNDYRGVISEIKLSTTNGEKVFIYPFYYRWILEHYKEFDEKGLPEIAVYGWEFNKLEENIKSSKPEQFWFILDYSSNDTITYSNKLNQLKKGYQIVFSREYAVIPNKVVLYKFKASRLQ